MGYLKIIRPLNCLITFISVCVGAWVGRTISISPALVLAAMIGFVVCAFGNIINDLFDVAIDRINNPERPLVKKTVNRNVVIALAVYFVILASLFSLSLGITVFTVVLGTIIILFLYAWILKKTPFANIVVSSVTGLSFILGGIVAKNPNCVYPFVFSFFIHVSREIIKDMIDKQGDERYDIRSIPILYGDKRAGTISALSLVVLCIILPVPFIMGVLGFWYLSIILIGVLPLGLYTIIKLLQHPAAQELIYSSRRIKTIMVIGLIAMIV